MTKSRLKSKFLSRDPGPPHRDNYRATLVWRWLQCVQPGTDEVGTAIRAMKSRRDMPGRFSNRTQITTYLVGRCKLDAALANRVVYHLWNLYSVYRDSLTHDETPTEVKTTQMLPNMYDPGEVYTGGNARSKFLSR